MTELRRRFSGLVISLTMTAIPLTASVLGQQSEPDTTNDHVEASLRHLLPPFMVEQLRAVRYTRGQEFATTLARRAEVPIGSMEGSISTDAFIDSMTVSYRSIPDLESYLRLRLFDLFIGDWSRRPSEIRWIQDQPGSSWQPVGSPYRNPIPLFRGIMANTVLLGSQTMTDFSGEFPPADRASKGLRYLDRRLLPLIAPMRWDSITLRLQDQLSAGVSSLPPGDSDVDLSVLADLRRRTETLAAASEDLRRVVDRWAAIHGTDSDDSVHIVVRQGHLVTVTIGPRGSYTSREELFFNSAGTQDLRLVLGQGNDLVSIEGPKPRIPLEVVGEGSISMLYRPSPAGPWRSIVPFGIRVHEVSTRPPLDRRDWGQQTVFRPWLDVDSDDGLFFGGGPVTTAFGFGLTPYAQQTSALVGLASSTLGVRVWVGYDDHELWRGVGLRAALRFAQADMTKFFGMGNETTGATSKTDVRKYEGRRRDLEMSGAVDIPLGTHWSASLSLAIQSTLVRADRGTVVDSLVSSGEIRTLNFGTAGIWIVHDSRGDALLPADAAYLAAKLEATPAFLQNRSPYLRAAIDAQWHLALADTAAVLVSRWSAEAMSGTPPWFESAAIGGSHSLRGYERERFRGQASTIAGVEARIPAWTIPFIWPHETGIIVFAETGRVFVRGEQSLRWHSSIGVGGWLRAVGSPYLASGTISRSPEDWKLSVTLGFAF